MDQYECNSHGGAAAAMVCKLALDSGQVALLWQWNGSTALGINGFHVYQVDGGQHTLVGNQDNGTSQTFWTLKIPPGGYQGKCYSVAAYAGSKESDMSAPVCIGRNAVVHTVTLSSQQTRFADHSRLSWLDNPDQITSGGGIRVGFAYRTSKHLLGDSSANTIQRSGLLFDVGALRNTTIRDARLLLSVSTSTVGADYHQDHYTSCVAQIGVGNARWWNFNDWIEGAVMLKPGEYQGPDVAYDVTSIVQNWASGNPNFGFVLLGEEENLGAFTEKSCQTTYDGNARLQVEYF